MRRPKYLALLDNDEFKERLFVLNKMLANCVLCPHQCEVNRLKGHVGYCKTLERVIVVKMP